MLISSGAALRLELPKMSCIKVEKDKTMSEFERDYIIQILEKTYWKVDGNNGAARILGMHPETLRSRMHKLEIKRPAFKE